MSTTSRNITVFIDSARRASAPDFAEIITDNSDYVITFDIDADTGFDTSAVMTAIFVTDRGEQPVDFSRETVTVPTLCRQDGGCLLVGLTQGEIRTTSSARIHIRRSIKALASGASAEPYTPDTEQIVSDVDGADLIRVNDVSLGKWIKATIATIAARIKVLIGVFSRSSAGLVPAPGADTSDDAVLHADGSWGAGSGGDSYWTEDDNHYLVPDSDINLDGREVLNAVEIVYGDDPATDPRGMTYRRVNVLPQTAPTTEAEKLVLLTTDDHYYRYTGDAWKKLVYADDAVITEKYVKPQSGIPKTDLASDVQASLGKADSALQEHQSLAAYRTAAAQDVIDGAQDTAIAAKYSKPAGGIPASDIASGVIPDVSGKEDKSNKVTALSASSTDTQYPSAKCVYDLVGNIESLLSAI